MAQSPTEVLLIRPSIFGYNEQTAATNHFQHELGSRDPHSVYAEAMRELKALEAAYRKAGIVVHVFESNDKNAPDAIFPNSITTFPPGCLPATGKQDRGLTLHPMLEPSRRRERSKELIEYLKKEHGYKIAMDLSQYEDQNRALEGTGSMVLDRVNRFVYCALSRRSDHELAKMFCDAVGFELVAFETDDGSGFPVYHTDVLMHIGTGFAAVCAPCIKPEYREVVMDRLQQTHHVIELSMKQMEAFCGNALELQTGSGNRVLSISARAFEALEERQKQTYLRFISDFIVTPVTVIEDIGGGSVRCMTQELF